LVAVHVVVCVVVHKGAVLVMLYVMDPATPVAELNVPVTE
jgi:hypothetical protein